MPMTWRCSCFGLLVAPLFLHDINQNPKNACGVHVILAGLAQTAEQRAPHVGLAFADPTLLDLDPPFQRECPVRGGFRLSRGRRAFPLCVGLDRVRMQDRRLVIAGLRLGKPPPRFLDPCTAVFDHGLPGHPVNRERRPALRFRQQRAIAGHIGFRGVDVAVADIAKCEPVVQAEQLALALGLLGERRHLLGKQRIGALVVAGLPQQPHEELLVAAALVLVIVARGIVDGKFGVAERVTATEQRSCLRPLVIEVGEIGALQARRHGRIGGGGLLLDLGRVGLLLIENRGDVGDRSRRRHERRGPILCDVRGARFRLRRQFLRRVQRSLRPRRHHGVPDAALDDGSGFCKAGFVRASALLAGHIGRLAAGVAATLDRLIHFQRRQSRRCCEQDSRGDDAK